MKKLMTAFALMGAMGSAFAQSQSTSETTLGKAYKALQESNLSLTVDETFETTRDDTQQITGIDNVHEFYFNYKLTDNDSLRLYHRFDSFYFDEKKEDKFTVDSTELRYKRANLLTEDKHGVAMNAQLRYLLLNSRNNTYALANGRLEFTKNITDKFSALAQFRYDIYQHAKQYDLANTKQNRLRVYFIPSYALSDKLSVSTMFLYSHNYFENKKTNSLIVLPEVAYQINDVISLAGYMDMTPMVSNDGKTFESSLLNNPSTAYGVRLSISAF